jgi:antitoxin component of MazEF toxin-antitoxin module
MHVQQLRRHGNSFVVTVPKELVEANGWREGQLLGVDFTEMRLEPVLGPELEAILRDELPNLLPALRTMDDR